jgi:phage head maturation protease
MSVMVKTVPAGFSVKAADSLGQAQAVIATYGQMDLDRDIVVRGAFTDGAQAPISPYNHSSLSGTALPVGLATVHTEGNLAIADLVFNMEVQAARDVWAMVKQLGAVMEYSWGWKAIDSEPGTGPDGRPVVYLKALDLIEVSPVIRGSSIGTGTVPGTVKAEVLREYLRSIKTRWCPDLVPIAARELVARERLRYERHLFEQAT